MKPRDQDLMTFSAGFLEERKASSGIVERSLDSSYSSALDLELISVDDCFSLGHDEDAMVAEKRAEGIRGFAAGTEKHRQLIAERLS